MDGGTPVRAPRFGPALNVVYRNVNGALLFADGDTPLAGVVLDLIPACGQVYGIDAVRNPYKRSHVD
ncbi:hypothetical protein OG792_20970 [Micromonospora sp. NBC_01699]|uniref:hypothetical protein n=1 Tax=Micromonospora sp. NBC_01699 TaxID=2975984 RepID=UPI002E2931A4|nr:hypothetical protein [Micromonospora sp. NBC_01699]